MSTNSKRMRQGHSSSDNDSQNSQKNQLNHDHQFTQEDDEDDDDLLVFQQHDRHQLLKKHNLQTVNFQEDESDFMAPFIKKQNQQIDTFSKFYGNQQKQMQEQVRKKQKNISPIKINQEELSAKKLRSFNAAKYFQKIKIALMKQVYNNIQDLTYITDKLQKSYEKSEQQFNLFLSLLPAEVLVKCFELRNKNIFTTNQKQILDLFKSAFTDEILKELALKVDKINNHQYKKQYQGQQQQYQFIKKQHNIIPLTKTQLMFKFSYFLPCKIRKIQFFNIEKFVQQTFYSLDYDKKDKKTRKSKKAKNYLQQKIKKNIQRAVYQSDLNDDDYVDFGSFTFEEVIKNSSKNQKEIQNQIKVSKKRGKKIQQMKKYFMDETYQIFSFWDNKWKIFMAVDGHFQEVDMEELKNIVLNTLPVIGFYSIQTLKAKVQFQQLLQLRKMKNIVIKDMSMHFCDNWRKLTSRKKRVGVKPLMGKIFRFCNYRKSFDILQAFEQHQLLRSNQQTNQILVKQQLPRSKIQFTFSEYFLTPSRVGKYHILCPQAKPVHGVEEYNDQRIYWKDDLIPVCSRMGWIDFERMVREGAQPLKKTQNRNKKQIQLFRYEQTKPFLLQMDQKGDFVLDPQHNSIYIPPKLELPVGTCILKEKITFICNKHKFKHAKLVQGFIHGGGMRVLPNEIGSIVYEKDRQEILRLYQERVELLNSKKESRYDQKIERMWRQVLKYVKLVQRMGADIRGR